MTDWAPILKKIAPGGSSAVINGLAAAMPQVIQVANLSTSGRLAQFIAQIAHESDGFRTTTEYASGREYNGRVDLGNRPGTNDGVTYKGRGLIQLTGRSNYTMMSKKLGVNLVDSPNLAAQFPYAALTAAYYWKDHDLNSLADANNINGITRKINGGYNGLESRKAYLARATAELSDVKMAQRRLQELNYPPGGADGDFGPLTRSALRDFQEANKISVTGTLTPETQAILHSDAAIPRPVSQARSEITASDLKEKGSKVIEASDEIKASTIGTGLATAAGVTTSASTIASNISQVADSAKNGESIIQLARDYWPVFVILASMAAIIFFTWRAYKSAKKVENERVYAARTGLNVRI